MTYLFLGEEISAKEARIEQLKKKILNPSAALNFDYEVLSAHKLEPVALKKALLNLPAIAPQRLVVIREAHRLSPQNQELIKDFLELSPPSTVLILDSSDWTSQDFFVKAIRKSVEVVDFYSSRKLNVFDMTQAIEQKSEVEALKILNHLLGAGIHPLQIMGAVVWFWGKSRSRLSAKRFEKGLLALQEADWNIKRSRLKPEHAIELLIVKLCEKEAC